MTSSTMSGIKELRTTSNSAERKASRRRVVEGERKWGDKANRSALADVAYDVAMPAQRPIGRFNTSYPVFTLTPDASVVEVMLPLGSYPKLVDPAFGSLEVTVCPARSATRVVTFPASSVAVVVDQPRPTQTKRHVRGLVETRWGNGPSDPAARSPNVGSETENARTRVSRLGGSPPRARSRRYPGRVRRPTRPQDLASPGGQS